MSIQKSCISSIRHVQKFIIFYVVEFVKPLKLYNFNIISLSFKSNSEMTQNLEGQLQFLRATFFLNVNNINTIK